MAGSNSTTPAAGSANPKTQNFLADQAGLSEETYVRHVHLEVPLPAGFEANECSVQVELGSMSERFILQKLEILSWHSSCNYPVTVHFNSIIPTLGELQLLEFEPTPGSSGTAGTLLSRGSVPYHYHLPSHPGGMTHMTAPSAPDVIFDASLVLQQLFEEVDDKYLTLDLDEIDRLPTTTYNSVKYRLLVEDARFKHFVDPIKQYIKDNAASELFRECVRYSNDILSFRDDKRQDLFGPMIERIHSQLLFLQKNQSITFRAHGTVGAYGYGGARPATFGALPDDFDQLHAGAKALLSIPQKLGLHMRFFLIPVRSAKGMLTGMYQPQQQVQQSLQQSQYYPEIQQPQYVADANQASYAPLAYQMPVQPAPLIAPAQSQPFYAGYTQQSYQQQAYGAQGAPAAAAVAQKYAPQQIRQLSNIQAPTGNPQQQQQQQQQTGPQTGRQMNYA